MMKQVFRLSVCVVGLTLLSSTAFAQVRPWEGKGYFVNLNFGMQVGSDAVATTSETRTIYDEPGTFTTEQTIEIQAPMIDVGGGVRLIRNFGVGFFYSRLRTEGSGVVTAKVPNPIVYGQLRTASASLDGLEHVEQGFHFQAIFMLPLTETFDVVFSGGPTLFSLSQGTVATPVAWSEVGPPYTTVNLAPSAVTRSESQIGFNVGADFTYRFTKNLGAGGMIRYSAATVGLPQEGGSALDVKVGGFQVGGGLRLRF
jgi:hypothetical protein